MKSYWEKLFSAPPPPPLWVTSQPPTSPPPPPYFQSSFAVPEEQAKKQRHLYSTFSIWICSKALYNVRFTPSGPEAYIQSGLCMLVLILPTPGGWKAEWTLAGKKVTQIFNPRLGRGSNRGPQDWEAEIFTTALDRRKERFPLVEL